MSFHFSGGALRGLTLVSALLLSTAAFAAPDATKIATSLVAALQAKGDAKATFDSATANGDVVTITNLKVSSKEGGDATVPSVVITNPVERTSGGFTATSIAFDNGQMVDGERTVTWATGISNDAIVPDPTEMHSTAKITPFSHFAITSIKAADKTSPDPVTIGSVSIDLGNVVDGAPNEGKLAVTGINIPGSVLRQDEQTKDWVDQLGYQELTLDVAIDGSFDSSKDSLQIRTITIDGKDVGKLAINGDFGGLPRQKLQNPDQLKELASTATIQNATIRFDNAGIVQRVIEMQAKAMGATSEQFVEQISGALPLLLSALGNQGFQDKIASAASVFLKDPKSLTITATPGTPVPIMQIIGAAGTAPQTIPDILSVGIAANN
ncbi:hypothetical protein OSH11_01880 [Kaistia dalseonensis]|uniref:DUF2125 domain-containing protein n=1 Tax=Kaistia dalseonensis TaxID=410840 RepID=A0ABU0H3B7_9HYPH|nr:hypothetical protein [Kaistia dalseonensis]MCX5493445.1 hypothetical protein [Kaistia dalseonensis]MDQ0436004.1 hypothetical protein [Kaistia dalseonensis]